MNGNFFTSIQSWWRHPFQSGGSAFNWLMFVGLIVVAAFLWQLVLIEIAKGIGTEV